MSDTWNNVGKYQKLYAKQKNPDIRIPTKLCIKLCIMQNYL